MTTTEETQVTTTTTTTTEPTPVPTVAPGPNIKLNLELYQYGATPSTKLQQTFKRFLGKKGWKKVNIIIYEDSTMKVFEEGNFYSPVAEIKLENVAIWLAFAKAAEKYGAPTISVEESNFIAANNFFAVPESQKRDTVHWFATKDEYQSSDLMKTIASTLEGKANPPPPGKGSKHKVGDQEEKWKMHWTTSSQLIESANLEGNGDNNGQPRFVATPLVAVLENKKAQQRICNEPEAEQPKEIAPDVDHGKTNSPEADQKKTSSKLRSKFSISLQPKQKVQRDYYKIDFEMPEAGQLGYSSEVGLKEVESTDEEKTVVTRIRLINGKRIKETAVAPKIVVPESTQSPAPPNYPPPPVPDLAIGEEKPNVVIGDPDEANLQLQNGHPKVEVISLIKDESLIDSIILEAAHSKEKKCEEKDEIVEIQTSQHSALVNAASVEHTFTSSTEYAANGISLTTTKETVTIQNGTSGDH